MTRRNWDKLRTRDRVRRFGTEHWLDHSPFMAPLMRRTRPRESSTKVRELSPNIRDQAAAFMAWRHKHGAA